MTGCDFSGYGSREAVAKRSHEQYGDMGPRPEGMLTIAGQAIKHLALDATTDTLYLSVAVTAQQYRVVSISMATVRSAVVGDMTLFPFGDSDVSATLFERSSYQHNGFAITHNSYQAAYVGAQQPTPPPTPALNPTPTPTPATVRNTNVDTNADSTTAPPDGAFIDGATFHQPGAILSIAAVVLGAAFH